MSFMAAAAVAVAAYSAWQSHEAGQKEAQAHKDAARARRRQARKLLERARMNEGFTRLEGRGIQAKQASAFASSGIDLSSGIALATFEDTARRIERQIEIDNLEAQAQADAIIMGADLDITKGKMAAERGTQQGISQLIQTGFMMGSK